MLKFCLGGSLRGQGWKYGSGFVDGVFPVMSPTAQQIFEFVQKVVDVDRFRGSLDTLPPTHTTWDDLITVAVQLRLSKKWNPIIVVSILSVSFFYVRCFLRSLALLRGCRCGMVNKFVQLYPRVEEDAGGMAQEHPCTYL